MTQRQRWNMPEDVWEVLQKHKLTAKYDARPPYQRNDYIGWISQAKQAKTRQKRIDQMVNELTAGDVYMKMSWGKKSSSESQSKKPQSLDEYIKQNGPLFGDVMKQLDACLMKVNPSFTTKAAWGGWAYWVDDNYSCLIVRYKDHVKVMIMRGIMLDDPKKLLQGSGSNTRHLRFNSVEDIDCKYLSNLLMQQQALYDSGLRWEGSA